MSTPFTPFTVMFCRAIETCDNSFLVKLGDVVEVLQLATTSHLRSTYEKQLRLFQLMHNIASGFISSRPESRAAEMNQSESGASAMQEAGAANLQDVYNFDDAAFNYNWEDFNASAIGGDEQQVMSLSWLNQDQMVMGMLEDGLMDFEMPPS
jgi:hypothetical protein